MGWGDYIMTTGIVRRLKRQNPNLQILVKEPFNKTRQYRDIFYKNPFIVNTDTINEKFPHIKIPRVLAGVNDESKQKIIWSPERVAEVGDFYVKKEETDFAEKNIKIITEHWKAKNQKQPKGIIFISDIAKRNMIIDKKIVYYEHAVNKEWGEKKWLRFISITSEDYILLKTSNIEEKHVDGLYSIMCDFRTTFSIMKKCDFYIGLTGWICDERRNKDLRSSIKNIPLNRLMLETDSPFLIPRNLNPKPKSNRNEPKNLMHIATEIAQLRNESVEEICNATYRNSLDFFSQA